MRTDRISTGILALLSTQGDMGVNEIIKGLDAVDRMGTILDIKELEKYGLVTSMKDKVAHKQKKIKGITDKGEQFLQTIYNLDSAYGWSIRYCVLN